MMHNACQSASVVRNTFPRLECNALNNMPLKAEIKIMHIYMSLHASLICSCC